MKTAILLQVHKRIDHIFDLALQNNGINYYIHIDKKANRSLIVGQRDIPKNVYILEKRIDVKWGGFSQVEATISLFNKALSNNNNGYFHLISGEDFILKSLEDIEKEWDIDSPIYMDIIQSKPHRYRYRFDTLHADTIYTRSLAGKLLTKVYKMLDMIIPYNSDFCYYGSSWFSLRRKEASILFSSISELDIARFKKKLCPDEHFFQYMIAKLGMINKISKVGNKRFIKFDKDYNRGNNPIYLSYEQIEEAKEKDFWFARKYDFSKNN